MLFFYKYIFRAKNVKLIKKFAFFIKFVHCNPNHIMKEDINRIKVVLVEKKTNKWLAEQLGKDPATVSKWCTNTC